MRQISCSREVAEQAKQSKDGIVKVYSMFPVDRADCPCAQTIKDWQKKMGMSTPQERKHMIAENPVIECPRDKTGMTRYEIVCNHCGEVQGLVWATDDKLENWCDFHYTQWTTGDFWHGCFTPHISPISQTLCFECCCGQDTRDFRANMTLPEPVAVAREEKNKIGRKFGQKQSKFFVRKLK